MTRMTLTSQELVLARFIDSIMPNQAVDITDVRKCLVDSPSHNKSIYRVNLHNAVYGEFGNNALYKEGSTWKVVKIGVDSINNIKFGSSKNNSRALLHTINNGSVHHTNGTRLDSCHPTGQNNRTVKDRLCMVIGAHKELDREGFLSNEMIGAFESYAKKIIEESPEEVLSLISELLPNM